MVPTRGRPQNAVRLARAVREMSGREVSCLYFLTDPGEPLWEEYSARLRAEAPWAVLARVAASPQRIGPVLNQAAPLLAGAHTHVAFMGDDHLPRTPNWDGELVGALGGRPGVAYGNDLLQGENLPTMAVLSSDLIRGLGFFCPPGLEHLYLDDFWKLLGLEAGNLAYRGDVVVEHLHPAAGKAPDDPVYQDANSVAQRQRDCREYARYLADEWAGDLARLKGYLGD